MNLSDLNIKFDKSTLTNGSNLFVFSKKGAPITIRTIFWAGARFGKIQGISHFLEHMIVAGSKKYPTKDLLSARLENIGGSFGAYTDSDFLTIDINIADIQDLSVGLEILDEILHSPLFDDKTIENERKAILSEIGKKRFNPSQNIFDVSKRIFYQETVLKEPVLGTNDSISSITKNDLLESFEQLISRNKPTVIISGDVTSAEILPLLNLILKNNINKPKIPLEILPIINRKKIEIEKYEGEHSNIRVGFRVKFLNPKEERISQILATLLANSKSSILVNELRYRRGLVYDLGASVSFSIDRSIFTINSSTNPKNIQNVLDIIKDEISKVKEKGISQKQLDFLKNKLTKSKRFGLQTTQQIIDFHSQNIMINENNPILLDDMMSILEKITLEEVNLTIKDIFDFDNFFIAICGNVNEEDVK